MGFLPISYADMKERGWEELDFVLITGDAYVDHPSFGAAVISRFLESRGYRIGIIAQPRWDTVHDFTRMGKPRLAVLITAGNIDSMVNHYTAAKRWRRDDVYSPGGRAKLRPDRATIVYSHRVREAFGDIPIILGGLEASLRRMSHYDYWDNAIRPSLLVDSGADLIVYGMGEHQIIEVAEALEGGLPIRDIIYINGTVFPTSDLSRAYQPILLPQYQEMVSSREKFAQSFLVQYQNTDARNGKTLVEPYDDRYVVQNPPALPLSRDEMDQIYSLPYMRTYHPRYEKEGGVPAIKEVRFSIVTHRGCFGGCNFCSLSFHQGRVVQSRSHSSVINEAEQLIREPDFKGYIHDVGGPTANFLHPACKMQLTRGACKTKQCLFPSPCRHLFIDHSDFLSLLRTLRKLPGVKKVFVRSGIRYDYLLYDNNEEFFEEFCRYHISGQLKVAPEHVSEKVLKMMGKSPRELYDRFVKKYFEMNQHLGLKQYLVPYLISSHPGSDLSAAIQLAEYVRDMDFNPEQVQDFYPTPGTFSTCMYYTGLDPRTMEKVYIPGTPHEKAMQRALIQYRDPQNYDLVHEALIQAGRRDLIGTGKKCLIRPRKKTG
ncbi:MAG: YgiQ family radical SAM protein [Candidatus Atribacteria bacterium]|nr:YgiQ family radical SAM protein [Candidatus Atribacteria bacterium]